jgi:beta-N-acetylhexosaminidase
MREAGAIGEMTSLALRKRRAGQRLLVGFDGTSPAPEFVRFVREAAPAGFILFARNVEEPAQVRELNRELAALLPASLPPLLSVDQEGGRVQRVKATRWPTLRALGNIDHLPTTAQFARALADEVRALGFNLNFAPCADVDSNPKNPVIGDRSFGPDPGQVVRHVAAFVEAAQARGLVCCAKHFPGHGDTSVDSHLDLPTVERDRPEIERTELPPFAAAVQAGVGMVMTSHVVFPAYDESVPATMSEPILRGLLRGRLGWGGVTISDDLEMKAVRGRYPLDMQLDLASRAGVDLFCISRSLDLCVEAWETLVRLQELDPRHDDAATDAQGRLMALRERFFKEAPPAPPVSLVGDPAHRALAESLRRQGGDPLS